MKKKQCVQHTACAGRIVFVIWILLKEFHFGNHTLFVQVFGQTFGLAAVDAEKLSFITSIMLSTGNFALHAYAWAVVHSNLAHMLT